MTLKQLLKARPWMTERWVRRKVAGRRIPFAKADGILLFDLKDIDDFVERGRVESDAGAGR